MLKNTRKSDILATEYDKMHVLFPVGIGFE